MATGQMIPLLLVHLVFISTTTSASMAKVSNMAPVKRSTDAQSTDGQFIFKHHDNKELNQVLQSVNQRCPNITRLYELSERSINGWPLTVIEFTTQPGKHELRKLPLFPKFNLNSRIEKQQLKISNMLEQLILK